MAHTYILLHLCTHDNNPPMESGGPTSVKTLELSSITIPYTERESHSTGPHPHGNPPPLVYLRQGEYLLPYPLSTPHVLYRLNQAASLQACLAHHMH